ncbi:MAG TPA: hypothetical protein VFB22_14240 [Candidatus Baltobacteraceae bacterium]|nr:hypothetical protein [Candidatus Baltobacteraceae bacterium]
MGLFVRVTAAVAIAIVALIVLGFILKILFVAALVAALVVGALFLWNAVRRNRSGGITTYTMRR